MPNKKILKPKLGSVKTNFSKQLINVINPKTKKEKFIKIMVADNPTYYDEKYFKDWFERPYTCEGVTKDYKEVLLEKNFKRRCDASRWARKNYPKAKIEQWFY